MTQKVAKSGLELLMVSPPPLNLCDCYEIIFWFLILLSLLVSPGVTGLFSGLHSCPPCPEHPPPLQAAHFLAQILLLISETARGDKKVKITSWPAYDYAYVELLDNDTARLPSPMLCS